MAKRSCIDLGYGYGNPDTMRESPRMRTSIEARVHYRTHGKDVGIIGMRLSVDTEGPLLRLGRLHRCVSLGPTVTTRLLLSLLLRATVAGFFKIKIGNDRVIRSPL